MLDPVATSTSVDAPVRPRRAWRFVLLQRLTSGLADVVPPPDVPSWSPALVILVAAGFALRLPWIASIPNPWGPETAAALRALHDPHAPAALSLGDRAFTAFLGALFAVVGPGIAAARLAVTSLLALGTLGAALLVRRRLAIVLATVLLLHPWSFVWSRTAASPAAVSLALAALGPLAWFRAVRTRNAVGMAVAAQITALAVHFSPFAVVPFIACAAWTALPAQRVVLYRREGWAALLAGAAHAGLALHFSPGLQLHAPRGAALASAFGALSGVTTLRSFTGASAFVEALAVAATVLLVALSVRRVASDALGRFAALQLGAALLLLPLMAGGERDVAGFVVVAPWAMWCAAWANTRPARAMLGALLLSLALTAWMASHFLQGSATELALTPDDPAGAFWGWQVPRERRAIVELARGAALADARGAPAVLGWRDEVFEPMRFELLAAPAPGLSLLDGDASPPAGTRVYRLTDGRRVLMGWRRVQHWTMTGGTPLAALWAAE